MTDTITTELSISGKKETSLGVVFLYTLFRGGPIALELKNKPFWQFLLEDITPAVNGWTIKFGEKWLTSCITVVNNENKIAFDAKSKMLNVVQHIPENTRLYVTLWMGAGTCNWRTEWIGNACETPLPEYTRSDDCVICLDKLERERWILQCGHVFHKDCISKSNKLCPMCRKERSVNENHWSKC